LVVSGVSWRLSRIMVETGRRPATARFHHNRAGPASPAIMTAARRLAHPGTRN
jgi:hypothetical protein